MSCIIFHISYDIPNVLGFGRFRSACSHNHISYHERFFLFIIICEISKFCTAMQSCYHDHDYGIHNPWLLLIFLPIISKGLVILEYTIYSQWCRKPQMLKQDLSWKIFLRQMFNNDLMTIPRKLIIVCQKESWNSKLKASVQKKLLYYIGIVTSWSVTLPPYLSLSKYCFIFGPMRPMQSIYINNKLLYCHTSTIKQYCDTSDWFKELEKKHWFSIKKYAVLNLFKQVWKLNYMFTELYSTSVLFLPMNIITPIPQL